MGSAGLVALNQTVAVRLCQPLCNSHDSGKHSPVAQPLAILATLFDRIGRHGPAATIARFRPQPRYSPSDFTASGKRDVVVSQKSVSESCATSMARASSNRSVRRLCTRAMSGLPPHNQPVQTAGTTSQATG